MALLKVDLQDGFSNDFVIVKINGEEIFREKNVTTKLVVGYAGSFEKDVQEGLVEVIVILPEKKLSDTFYLKVSRPLNLGISIQDSKINFIISKKSFAYM